MDGRTGSVLQPLLAFHAAAGARLALRAAVPVVAALVVALGLAPYPSTAIHAAAEVLAGPPALLRAALTVAAAFAFASWAGPRAAAGAAGWVAHLPCTAAHHRRALALAVAAGQAPLLILAALSALELPSSSSVARVAGVGIALVACALAVLPVRLHARWIAGAAACLGAWGSWETAAIGAAALAAADATAGPLRPVRARRLLPLPLPVPLAIALRAVGRDVPGAWGAAALPLLVGAAFLRHNTLSPAVADGAARLAGTLAVSLITASLARALTLHRPPWAWARSLPQSARARVLWDTAILGGAALPAASATAWLRGCGPSWGPVLVALPWLALRGAGAIRRRHTDAARLLAEGAFIAAWIALLPWLACVLPALAPWALRAAIGAERALSPHVWQERRHLPGGDPLAWDEGGAG